jgi:glycosyltransferase involved in cell wall biosynthesis
VFGSGVEHSWGYLRQREQNLVERLACVTHVVYLERHGTTSKGPLSVIGEVRRRLRASTPGGALQRAGCSMRFVRTPVVPIQGCAPVDAVNARLIARALQRHVSVPLQTCRALVCNPSPYVLATVRLVRFEALFDDVAQRYGESPETFGRCAVQIDRDLARLADVCTCDSRTLRADRAALGIDCWPMPQGLDVVFRERPAPLRRRAEADARPVVGFLGAVSAVVDWPSVAGAAAAMPDVRFVFCGPVTTGAPEDLPANVEFEGWAPPDLVPRVIAGFDVGLIPYVRNRRTDAVLPTKLVEYLGSGVRVVSAALPDVVAASEDAGAGLVSTYSDAPGLVAALRGALTLGPVPESVRSSIFEHFSWDRLVGAWVSHVEGAMSGRLVPDGLAEAGCASRGPEVPLEEGGR